MAERDAQVRFRVRPDGDPAESLKKMARAGRKAKEETDKLRDSLRGLGPPAKDVQTKVSDLFLTTTKRAQEAEGRINELAGAIRRLGLNTQQVSAMARQLGRDYQLSAAQINQALAAAGQAPIGPRGGGFRIQQIGLAKLGLAGLGAQAISNIGIGAQNALRTNVDDAIDQQVRASGGRFDLFLRDAIPGGRTFTNLATFDRRRALEEAMTAAERQRRTNAERQHRFELQAQEEISRRSFARERQGSDFEAALSMRLDAIDDPGRRGRLELRERLARAGGELAFAGREREGAEEQIFGHVGQQERALAGQVRLDALRRQVDTTSQIIDLKRQELDLEGRLRQTAQDRLRADEQRYSAARDAFRAQAEREGGRLAGFAEEFGRMTPAERARARRIGQRLEAGAPLSRDDAEFARSTGIFRDVQRQADILAGEGAGIQDLIRGRDVALARTTGRESPLTSALLQQAQRAEGLYKQAAGEMTKAVEQAVTTDREFLRGLMAEMAQIVRTNKDFSIELQQLRSEIERNAEALRINQ